MVNELLDEMKGEGCKVVGYVDNLMNIVRGQHQVTLTEITHSILGIRDLVCEAWPISYPKKDRCYIRRYKWNKTAILS